MNNITNAPKNLQQSRQHINDKHLTIVYSLKVFTSLSSFFLGGPTHMKLAHKRPPASNTCWYHILKQHCVRACYYISCLTDGQAILSVRDHPRYFVIPVWTSTVTQLEFVLCMYTLWQVSFKLYSCSGWIS